VRGYEQASSLDANRGRHVLEECRETAGGERARTVKNVALETVADS
jgi:hypothetical protein